MSELKHLSYRSLDDVHVIEGGLDGLAHYVESGDWRTASSSAFLVARDNLAPDSAFYAYDADEFRELIEQLLADGVDLTSDVLQERFDIHETTALPTVPIGAPASHPALVVTDRPVGVVVRSREEGPGVPPIIMAPPPPQSVEPTGQRAKPPAAPATAEPPSALAEPPDAAAPDEPVELLRRTPHLDPSDDAPAPGATFTVEVYADQQPARDDEDVVEIAIEAPADVTSFKLQVWLAPTHHFTVTGSPLGEIVIERDDDSSTRASFTVAVAADIPDKEHAALTALFSYDGRPAGRVTRDMTIGPRAPVVRPEKPAAALQISAHAEPPDLAIEVLAGPDSDGRRFQCKTSTRFYPADTVTETWTLSADSASLVAQYMDRFTKPGSSPKQRLAALTGAGADLFNAAPEGFRKLFWRIVDASKPLKSIYVVSSEPYVPWELMVPNRDRDDGPREQRSPLGVEFAVGRWIHEDHRSPQQAVPLTDGYVIAPKYPGLKALASSDEEATFVCDHFNGARIAPADFDTIDARLAERGASLVHFVCHGAATSAMQSIYLEPGDAEMTSVELGAMPGAQAAFYAKTPLVFLNACEVGRLEPALIGVGGFAKAFIALGARCVVAPLWSVRDSIAHEVAVTFYERIAAEPKTRFADVLREIRAKAYADGAEDTYAAYCFYGDPNAAQEPGS